MEHQGIVVAGGSARECSRQAEQALRPARRRRQSGRRRPWIRPECRGAAPRPGAPRRPGCPGCLPTHSYPGTKIAQDRKHSTHVIAVRVGQGDGIETADIARPQYGRDHVFADFKVSAGGLGAPDGTAGVDEQGFSLGRDQQQRISLAHVDGRDLEHAGMVGERPGIKDTRRGTGQGSDGNHHGKAAIARCPNRQADQQNAGNDGQCCPGSRCGCRPRPCR